MRVYYSMIASMIAAVAACATPQGEPDGCEGRCDGDDRQTVVACWIEPGTGDDPGFVLDALVCRLADPAYQSGITASTAKSFGEVLLGEINRPAAVLRFPASEYPVLARVHLIPRNSTPGLPGALSVSTEIKSASAATAERPQAWALPYSVGVLTIDSHVAGDLRLQTEINLAPFTDPNGKGTFAIDRMATLQYGATRRFPLAFQGPISASVGGRTMEFPAPGRYFLTQDSVVEHSGPNGDELVRCRAGAKEAAGHPVSCKLSLHPLLALSATARLGDSSVSLAGDAEVVVGTAAVLPASVMVYARLTAAGNATLDTVIRGRRVGVQLEVGAGEPSVGFMGFATWSTTLTCPDPRCELVRDAYQLPFTFDPNEWATSAPSATQATLTQNSPQTFVFASDPAAQELAGSLRVGASTTPIRLRPGN